MSTLTVPARFCGPPGTANGGWLAGTPTALPSLPEAAAARARAVWFAAR